MVGLEEIIARAAENVAGEQPPYGFPTFITPAFQQFADEIRKLTATLTPDEDQVKAEVGDVPEQVHSTAALLNDAADALARLLDGRGVDRRNQDWNQFVALLRSRARYLRKVNSHG